MDDGSITVSVEEVQACLKIRKGDKMISVAFSPATLNMSYGQEIYIGGIHIDDPVRVESDTIGYSDYHGDLPVVRRIRDELTKLLGECR